VSVVALGQSTRALVDRARMAGNLVSTNRVTDNIADSRVTGVLVSSGLEKSATNSRTKRSAPVTSSDLTEEVTVGRNTVPRLVNSIMFSKNDRPEWMMEDDVIDALPTATVASVISQWKMTQAMDRQNQLREDKATKSKGGLKMDQEVKTVKVMEGEDNATTKLHELRFMLRTPLLEPKGYWDLYPVKWPEVNKKVHLAHLGLDHVISAKTLELIHDRSDPTIAIKMFSNINVMMGREGTSKTSRVQQYGSYIEVEARDNWLEIASISQLEEALDNLVRVWTAMWPGEFGPANLRGVISKHKAFASSFENQDTRKKVLEDFMNRILADNAVRAGQKVPPLSYKEVDERAKDLVERKNDFWKGQKPQSQGQGQSQNLHQNQNQKSQNQRNQNSRQKHGNTAFEALKSKLEATREGKMICVWFNLNDGCQSPRCSRKHICGKIPVGRKDPCGMNHPAKDCKK
jgi:hypothetical protein